MNDLMQLLNALGLRNDTLGNQVGTRLAAQDLDPSSPAKFANLANLRDDPRVAKNQSFQNYMGPFEHQQFMRQLSAQDPVAGMGAGMMTTPYTAAKMAAPGLTSALAGGGGEALPSQPSLEEIIRSMQGMGQGFQEAGLPGPGQSPGSPMRMPSMTDAMDLRRRMLMARQPLDNE